MTANSFKAGEVCKKFDAKLVGNPDFEIKAVGDPRSAGTHTACFISNPAYLESVSKSPSSFWVLTEEFYQKIDSQVAKQKNFAITKNPYLFFVNLMSLFYPIEKPKPGIHPMSFVHAESKVDKSAQVGAFVCIEKDAVVEKDVVILAGAYIGEGVRIGRGSTVHAGAKIYHHCVIGERCTLHSGSVIGADGFGFINDGSKQVKIPQVGKVIIGDDVEVGANTAIDRGTFEDTVIGNGVKIDNLVQIGHNCRIGDHTIVCGHCGIAGNTIVGKNCLLSGKVGTKGHIEIGDNVQVGGQSGVTKDIASNSVIKGYPAMPLKDYLKIHALYLKLPEIYKRLGSLEKMVLNKETKEKES